MDRRKFIKTGAMAAVAARLGMGEAFARKKQKVGMPEQEAKVRRGWDGQILCEMGSAGPDDLTLKFLGTGASGWTGPDCGRRRHSSVLLDGKVLIDLTFSAKGMLGEGCHPKTIFYTHSHGDHFDPEMALETGVKKAYVSCTWVERAKQRFAEASAKTGIAAPEIMPLEIGQKVVEEGICFTAMPGNHATNDIHEQALIYLIEKGTTDTKLGVRLIYATDTGGLLQTAVRIAGVDPLQKPGRPITGFIMEGTIPFSQPDDYRIFSHTTLEGAGHTLHSIMDAGRYCPPDGQPAYITHMSTKNFLPHDELNRQLEWPLRAPYDGQEIIFRAVTD